MTKGRTLAQFSRFYANGYDLSGDERSIGPLGWAFGQVDVASMPDNVKGYLPGVATVDVGTLNANFSNAASGSLPVGDAAKGAKQIVLLPVGIQAAPVVGDPAFMGEFESFGFTAAIDSGGGVTATMPFNGWSARASSSLYAYPWGLLMHAKGAETAVNTGTGLDNGAATAHGGYAVFQLFSSDGNSITMKVQDAATNTNVSFADLVTSGVLDASVTPKAILVPLSNTAAVRQFTRFQIVFGAGSTATFSIGFVRIP
jgi:hypothetical protein